ncbi:hypothetical protein D3C87_1944750 [compost metagenome]
MGDGAGGEDAYALCAQALQRLSQLPQLGRGEVGRDGELHQGDLALGIHQGEG